MPESRHYCPHCEERVSLSTLHRHKRLYYREDSHTWIRKSDVLSDSASEDELTLQDDEVSCGGGETSSDTSGDEGDLQISSAQMSMMEEEDEALLESVTSLQEGDEGDVDDGEFWGDIGDNDCAQDLSDTGLDNIVRTNTEVEEEQIAVSVATFLTVMIAKWSYRYNITATALGGLLKLLKLFFVALSAFSSIVKHLVSVFPSSVFMYKHYLDVKEDNFDKYVVCPSCHSLYKLQDCFETVGRRKTPKVCQHVNFPNHPHVSRRQICGSRLLAEVTLNSGNKYYYPRKYYCYNSVANSLSTFAKREGFLESCEHWRLRQSLPNMLCDIYDGQVWTDFQFIGDVPFLAAPYNLALMLNIDWFRPFKHTPYSVGAIYMVITNLPRSERFKKENVILVGIVPGPNEPPLHMNTYLKPLVDELNQLWQKGIEVTAPNEPNTITLKAALICVACDIPACRKVLGFCGHNSKKGCSKCTKTFIYDRLQEKFNFGGFTECPLRNEDDHRTQAYLSLEQNCASRREKVEKTYGVRFSALMGLAYFNTVRCHVVDPMHNLFLGTAKNFTKNILLNQDPPIIQKAHLNTLQERVDNCIVPSTLGRIPHKIASSCASFTADQWKMWTNVFSVYALRGLLDDNHFKCWKIFVSASQMLSKPVITVEDAEKGHKLLMEFCTEFESIYGSDKITPNMHLHMHILDCIKDYGPFYSFWLFSFERYNGLLGGYRTNQRSVELQIMRMFLSDLHIHDLQIPSNFVSNEELGFLVPSCGAGTLRELSYKHTEIYFKIMQTSKCSVDSDYPTELWSVIDIYCPGGIMSTEILSEPFMSYLAKCYCSMYPGQEFTSNNISSGIHKYSHVKVSNEIFGSQGTRTSRSSYVLAQWCGRHGRIDSSSSLRPARVAFYFKHSLMLNGCFKPHYFAFVEWYQNHSLRHLLGGSVEVWCHSSFEELGPASFLPLQRIQSKFVAAKDRNDDETLLFVMPLHHKAFL